MSTTRTDKKLEYTRKWGLTVYWPLHSQNVITLGTNVLIPEWYKQCCSGGEKEKTLVHPYRDYSIPRNSTSGGWCSNTVGKWEELFWESSVCERKSPSPFSYRQCQLTAYVHKVSHGALLVKWYIEKTSVFIIYMHHSVHPLLPHMISGKTVLYWLCPCFLIGTAMTPNKANHFFVMCTIWNYI